MKYMKKIASIGTIIAITSPIATTISCGSKSEVITSYDKLIKIYNSKKAVSNYMVNIGHLPQNENSGNKRIINIGVTTSSLKGYQDWKTNKDKVSNSTYRALYDIVNAYNLNSTSSLIKIEEFDKTSDISAVMMTKNSNKPIPNLIFGTQGSMSVFSKFKNAFKTINSSSLGIENNYERGEFLPFVNDPLVAAIDFRLMNGLLYAYNKFIDSNYVTKGLNEESKLVSLNDVLMTSISQNGAKKTLKNLKFNSHIFGSTILTYQKLIDDSNLFSMFVKGLHSLSTNVEWNIASSFPELTLYGLSSKKGVININNIDSSTFNTWSNIYKNDSLHYKRTDNYNTVNLPTSDVMLDYTKSYSLKYFMNNHNTTYIPTPGFTMSNLIGFKEINSNDARTDMEISKFMDFLYNGNLQASNFTSGLFGTQNTQIGVRSGENVRPIDYYSLWTQKVPVKTPSQYFDTIIKTRPETYRCNTKLLSIFTTDLKKNSKEIFIPSNDSFDLLNDSLNKLIVGLN